MLFFLGGEHMSPEKVNEKKVKEKKRRKSRRVQIRINKKVKTPSLTFPGYQTAATLQAREIYASLLSSVSQKQKQK